MARSFLAVAGLLLLASPAPGQLAFTDDIPGTFVDISSSGVPLGLGDDGVVELWPQLDLTQTLFAGGDGRVWISNNGALGFLAEGSGGAYYLNAEIPSFALFGGAHGTPQALAVYWDDLDSDTGDVYYATVGPRGSQVFVVQWHDRPHYPGNDALDGDEVTFQVQIFESAGPGHAQFLYLDVDFQNPNLDEGASATIGYQAGGIGNDAQWSFNTPGSVTAATVLTLIDATPECPWDLNGNGVIDLGDLAELLSSYGGCVGDPGYNPAADFDDDGCVGLPDLAELLSVYGTTCP